MNHRQANNNSGMNKKNKAIAFRPFTAWADEGTAKSFLSRVSPQGSSRTIAGMLMLYDAVTIVMSYFFALWFRFDCRFSTIPKKYYEVFLHTIIFYALFCIGVFAVMNLYRSIWRFASYMELYRVTVASAVTLTAYSVAVTAFVYRMPISYFVFGICFQYIFTLGIRFAYRFVTLLQGCSNDARGHRKKVMLVGAGSAGRIICRDIKVARETNEEVCCFIDDDPNKWGRYIDGVKVIGGRDKIISTCERMDIEKIYITIPSASAEDKRAIISICNEADCELMNLPGVYQLYTGEVSVSKMKEVAVEDLLGRDPIKVNMKDIFPYIRKKVILVTGGGGSIGSELCRQIAAHEPEKLILFDIYENNAYDMQQELKKKYPELDLEVRIGSVRDSRMVFKIFETYHPQIVYHAAAHKHVPLMEGSPCEAIKNNAIGTYKTAYAAMVHGCERFVLISTDKAVNPTNIMGASKRLCEMVIQAFDYKIKKGRAYEIPQLFTHPILEDVVKKSEMIEVLKHTKTEFVAVRFGNVLGSNGSVIPLFKKQIAAGGPVTVTHPDIIRYFMTIPEAVSLVLLAGTFAHGGEIFVLDMGEPVKIDALARNLIRMSGHRPNVDIKIEYSGLRPGEKLYEEKLMAEEGLKKTENDLIHIGLPIPFNIDIFLQQLESLMEAAYKNKDDIRDRVEAVVNTYHPANNPGQPENKYREMAFAEAAVAEE